MDETRILRAFGDLERLRAHGQLSEADHAARFDALRALMPGGDARRNRASARPITWFFACEAACKLAILSYAVLVA